ncbi:MAG: hypothetical protein WCG26_12955 [Chloroflexales bacterium]
MQEPPPSGAVQVLRSGASVAPYRAVLEVLRSAIASGRGRLDSADPVQEAADFHAHMAQMGEIVGPVLALLAHETRMRHAAEIERERCAGALTQVENERNRLVGDLSQAEAECKELTGALAQVENQRERDRKRFDGELRRGNAREENLAKAIQQGDRSYSDAIARMAQDRNQLAGALAQANEERADMCGALREAAADLTRFDAELSISGRFIARSLARATGDRWLLLLVNRAGLQMLPTDDGWRWRIPRLAHAWSISSYLTEEETFEAAVDALTRTATRPTTTP